MSFYSLTKGERLVFVAKINKDIFSGLSKNNLIKTIQYFSDTDTYVRKSAYQAIGKIYYAHLSLQKQIILILRELLACQEFKVRQSAVNAAGEIGIKDFEAVEPVFDKGLFDGHHSVRNAVIGSIKKMGSKNPEPVLIWAKRYLHHPDKEIRREICHGIELRGRSHPQDILPLLQELQYDKTPRVKNTLVHVLGQISYKKDCLHTVISALNTWDNKELTDKAIAEIIDVHNRYRNFTILTQQQAIDYIHNHYKHHICRAGLSNE